MNILLAVDNSPQSKVAIDVLANRVWPDGSVIKVFCALERREPVFAVMSTQEAALFHGKALDAAKQFTESTANFLAEKFPNCTVVSEAMFADSKEVILKQAEQWPADLIAVGSHGRHGLHRLFLGSVSQTVLLYGSCSTLIARYQHAHEGVPEFDKNILLSIDDTVHSKKAKDWVLNLPWDKDTKFMMISTIPSIVDKYSDGIDALYASKYSGDRMELKQSAQKFLDDSATELRTKFGNEAVTTKLLEGDPAELVLSLAREWPAGLIVMGTRSRGHMTRLFMGSVSQEVVLQAPCPVEVVK